MKKNILLFILLFILKFNYLLGQEVMIYGKIEDQTGSIENANILNKETNEGAFSDENGMFSIKASFGQKLEISSVQHHTKIIRITKDILLSKIVTIQLRLKDNLLEEVTVSNKKLFGTYKRKTKQTTRDIAVVKSRNALDFSDVKIEPNKNYNKSTTLNRELNNIIDPTQRFDGASLGGTFIPFKSLLKKRKERKYYEFKRKFPELILKEFGENYFFNELKIPKTKFYHFLEYCNPLGIEKLFKDGKKLEVLEILNSEAKSYLLNSNHK
ncbi:carboxypeptidase-like regulatory domain-containing protein [Tenacibaculum sp. MEBiC06402]|uniref:carboxypeptidase-like regulatory domain-containing protein n=1 Tax=unclassified Tenacibaculum TaxID=2635139 RepID=UPI003B9CB2D2